MKQIFQFVCSHFGSHGKSWPDSNASMSYPSFLLSKSVAILFWYLQLLWWYTLPRNPLSENWHWCKLQALVQWDWHCAKWMVEVWKSLLHLWWWGQAAFQRSVYMYVQTTIKMEGHIPHPKCVQLNIQCHCIVIGLFSLFQQHQFMPASQLDLQLAQQRHLVVGFQLWCVVVC